jgi:hypothetical protein
VKFYQTTRRHSSEAAENLRSEIEPVSETNCFKKIGMMDEVKKKRLNEVKAAFLSDHSVTNPESASLH